MCALGQGGQQAPPAGSSNAQDAVASFGTTVVMPSGLRGLVYFLAEGTIRLPDFSKMRPVGIIYTSLLERAATGLHDWVAGYSTLRARLGFRKAVASVFVAFPNCIARTSP